MVHLYSYGVINKASPVQCMIVCIHTLFRCCISSHTSGVISPHKFLQGSHSFSWSLLSNVISQQLLTALKNIQIRYKQDCIDHAYACNSHNNYHSNHGSLLVYLTLLTCKENITDLLVSLQLYLVAVAH